MYKLNFCLIIYHDAESLLQYAAKGNQTHYIYLEQNTKIVEW